MYRTTNDEVKPGWHQNSSTESPVVDERFSLPYIFRWRKNPNSSSSTSSSTAKGLRDFCTKIILLIMSLCLTFVIVLWSVSLIADGPIETHRCITLWPIVAGVLVICFLFLILGGVDYCMHELNRRKNLKNAHARSALGRHDSLQIERPIRKKIGDTYGGHYVVYHQHSCVTWSYLFLTIALLCLMISSVWQYFTLGSSCYSRLKANVKELLLGYELLAYMSAVVLSIISCIIVCCLFAIILECLKSLFGFRTQPDSYTVTV